MTIFLQNQAEMLDTVSAFLNSAWGAAIGAVLLLVFVAMEIHEYRRTHRVLADCGFCASANGKPITKVVRRWRWRGVVALEVPEPVTEGHVVVVSRWHTRDAGENPKITAMVMRCAAELVAEHESANIIASKGAAATQKFFHLHAHVAPRREGDGLPLLWTGQVRKSEVVD